LALALQVEGQILNQNPIVSGIRISAMRFHRNSDGGVILNGGTPPKCALIGSSEAFVFNKKTALFLVTLVLSARAAFSPESEAL
jgi:hypothetical protein